MSQRWTLWAVEASCWDLTHRTRYRVTDNAGVVVQTPPSTLLSVTFTWESCKLFVKEKHPHLNGVVIGNKNLTLFTSNKFISYAFPIFCRNYNQSPVQQKEISQTQRILGMETVNIKLKPTRSKLSLCFNVVVTKLSHCLTRCEGLKIFLFLLFPLCYRKPPSKGKTLKKAKLQQQKLKRKLNLTLQGKKRNRRRDKMGKTKKRKRTK